MLTLIQKLAHLCLKPLIALFDLPIVPAELTTLVVALRKESVDRNIELLPWGGWGRGRSPQGERG